MPQGLARPKEHAARFGDLLTLISGHKLTRFLAGYGARGSKPLNRDRHWSNTASADWTSAVVVALVLTVVTLIAAIAITAFDNSARFASRYSSAASELPRTVQGGGSPETDGRTR
jgi:hypothetical protein